MRISVRSTPGPPGRRGAGRGAARTARAGPARDDRGQRHAHARRVADGRHLLPRAAAGLAAVRRGRRRGRAWTDALHPRGDEAHERGEGRRRGSRARRARRERRRPSSSGSSSSSSSRSSAGRRSDMPLTEIASGLRRWTAWHEEWREEVGCLAVDTADGLVLIDPLDPPRGLTRPQHVLLTIRWHARSTKAPHVWAHRREARSLANRGVEVTVRSPGTSCREGSRPSRPRGGRGRVLAPSAACARRRRRPARRRGEAARHRRAVAALP